MPQINYLTEEKIWRREPGGRVNGPELASGKGGAGEQRTLLSRRNWDRKGNHGASEPGHAPDVNVTDVML